MGTTADLIAYYQGLLVMQYAGKAKASAHVGAQVAPALLPQGSGPTWTDPPLPQAIRDAFNLVSGTTIAGGSQLDLIGKYVGVSRNGLSDADFLTLVRLAIIQNSSDSSLAGIQALIAEFFSGQLRVTDNRNMQLSYLVSTALGSLALVKSFVAEGLLPKPAGVSLALPIYAANINIFYGWRTYYAPAVQVSPINSYASYQTNRPWLTYAQAVVP